MHSCVDVVGNVAVVQPFAGVVGLHIRRKHRGGKKIDDVRSLLTDEQGLTVPVRAVEIDLVPHSDHIRIEMCENFMANPPFCFVYIPL